MNNNVLGSRGCSGWLFERVFFFCAACIFFAGAFTVAQAAQVISQEDAIQTGVSARNHGNIQLSIDLLSKAWETAESDRVRTRASAELGTSLHQARRLDDAEKFLKQAYSGSSGVAKARVAVELGNLAVTRKNSELARRYYDEAETLAGADLSARLAAGLNRARLGAESDRLPALFALFGDIASIGEPNLRARLYLNLGSQAKQITPQGLELAYRSFSEAHKLLPQLEKRLVLETLDALAQLYEDQGRMQEALRLTQEALQRANGAGATKDEDILVRLEWRMGRISQLDGHRRNALSAYQNAARHLEAIRQDLPIEYEDGRSSFRVTLQPVFNGLVDLTLKGLDELPKQERESSLRAAIHTIELTKQSEMQDYLGDRCSIDGIRSDTPSAVPAKSAVLYPVMLPDRLELLLDTDGMILRRTVNVSRADVEELAKSFAMKLSTPQRYGSKSATYLAGARQFYDWLLRPFAAELTERNIQTLVVVPDGALRLIPLGALHDGAQFAIERFAISTVTGMSMTSVQAPGKNRVVALLAGLSEPGPVIGKLSPENARAILGDTGPAAADHPRDAADPNPAPTAQRGTPQIRSARLRMSQSGDGSTDPAERAAQLKKDLSLPSVKAEIQALMTMIPNVTILDQAFTLGRFSQEAASGDYRILHVASHAEFGGSVGSSYIMTYDELLTMDRLESLLQDKQGGNNSIELFTLSACQTAEGNERSPLGISGAAIKAKARSVIGSLWPVEDDSARKIMETFYEGLIRNNSSKALALQGAQTKLLANEATSHPFFWAPFVLIGNWM